ncbi:serine/threonine-protein kinase STY46-like [Carex rostrata]
MEESAERGKVSASETGNGNGNGKGKGAVGPNCQTKKEQEKQHVLEVYEEVLRNLKVAGMPEFTKPGFAKELWDHFHRLPARYAMDVNVEKAEDILMHMNLLEDARNPAKQPSFLVRLVHVSLDEDDTPSDTDKRSIHPSPSFDTTKLRDLVRQVSISQNHDEGTDSNPLPFLRLMHEITFASQDKPKFLNQITCLLGDLNLNIEEAHVFSTNDGFSLDVFIVIGWPREETEQLTTAIEEKIKNIKEQQLEAKKSTLHIEDAEHRTSEEYVKNQNPPIPDHIKIPSDGTDEWEIDVKCLKFGKKVASGTYGDLYRGVYFGQDVAIKVIKDDRLNDNMVREFGHEVGILRKVRHKNVVQFIGACTKLPNLCIVTEFMSGGSLYDHLHKHKAVINLPTLIRIALDIAKGMDYLHQHNIIHRDLKTANILIDDKEAIKIADFGVARVKSTSGVMTAETGTYRWMAPEIIAHTEYDHKADVFSFGIMLWELLTIKIPYEYLTPLQAAIGVVQKELRPTIPKGTNPELAKLMEKCWQQKPSKRPDFGTIINDLQHIANEVGVKAEEHHKLGFLSRLKLK